MSKFITCIAPVNIAVIKYWGKRDEELIIPINDSVSTTLSTDHMCTTTTVMVNQKFSSNRIWLNGKEENFGGNIRLQNCLAHIKKSVSETDNLPWLNWNIHICSTNNFPTAAGLASSAAGYACLVYALSQLYMYKGDISAIARIGSGSACRSVLGGWVHWSSDPSASIATQWASVEHWPEMRVIILIVNDNRKKCSSTIGMRNSIKTSSLIEHRASCVVPKRIELMRRALNERDFNDFAKLTMTDSNQFHAICLDTYPPCMYLNDLSKDIIEMVHAFNDKCGNGNCKLAYTFDAGPNAVLYTLEHNLVNVLQVINDVFPPNNLESPQYKYYRGLSLDAIKNPAPVDWCKHLGIVKHSPGSLKYVITTKLGDGPAIIDSHLLDNDGMPLNK